MKRWTYALALASAACRHDHAAPRPDPVVTASASSAPTASVASSVAADAAPPSADACAEYHRRLDARLHRAIAGLADAGWTEDVLARSVGPAGLTCSSFARGAWWVEPGADLDVKTYTMLTSHETIHASVDGRVLGPWSPDGSGIGIGAMGMPASLSTMVLSDYDGDGVPELYVRTDEDGVEGGHVTESWIVTAHGGTIHEYGPAKGLGKIDTPLDYDGDGLLDLPVSLGAYWVEGQCMSTPDHHPANFLAHALPNGKFSTTDAVATKRLNSWCPAMPAHITSPEHALCARLRTKPADLEKVRASIAASCVPVDCEAESEGKPRKPGADHVCNDMLDTFDQETTLSL